MTKSQFSNWVTTIIVLESLLIYNTFSRNKISYVTEMKIFQDYVIQETHASLYSSKYFNQSRSQNKYVSVSGKKLGASKNASFMLTNIDILQLNFKG